MLRPYQEQCDAAAREAIRNHRSAMVVMPTGTGKTVVFANTIDRWITDNQSKALVLAHRRELIEQAESTISRFTDRQVGVLMGDRKEGLHADVLVASKDSLHQRRLDSFNPREFGLLVVDESHRSARHNLTYQRIRDHFRDAKVLGYTATPDRTDNHKLIGKGREYETLAYHYPLWAYGESNAIDDGWLVPPRQEHVVVEELDFSAFRTSGDWTDESIAAVMGAEGICHRVAQPTLDRMGDRPAVVFCATVDHAQKQARVFNNLRSGSACVIHGGTPPEQRQYEVARFRRGDYQFLVNCDIATEGFDCDSVAGVVICRPTKSRLRFAQMVGRGTRPLKELGIDQYRAAEERREAIRLSGKPDCLVLGFFGNITDLKLTVDVATLLGDDPETVERAREIQQYRPATQDLEALKRAKAQLAADRALEEEDRQRPLDSFRPSVIFRVREVNPLAGGGLSMGNAGQSLGGVTKKQAALLVALGVDPKTVSKYGKQQAGGVIDSYRRREKLPDWRRVSQARKDGFTWLVGEYERSRSTANAS